MFSNLEKRDLIKVYYQSNCNSTVTAERYFNLYPERHQPNPSIFSRLDERLAEYGSFNKPREKYGSRLNIDARQGILNEVNEDPTRSTREIGSALNVPHTQVWRELKSNSYKPYKINVSHSLHPGDMNRRLAWCNWINQKLEGDEDFLSKIIWSDETRFTNSGMFNRNNEHYWSVDNPHQNRQVRNQHRFGFNVWVGLYKDRLLGPFIYHETLNGGGYLNFLRTQLLDYLNDIPLDELRLMWFQQDGASPHNSRNVRDYLNEIFPRQWMGTYGAIQWPARSPDLSPLDYFLWGRTKNILYKNQFHNIEELRNATVRVLNSTTAREIQRSIGNLKKRIRLCINCEGGLFEHLI